MQGLYLGCQFKNRNATCREIDYKRRTICLFPKTRHIVGDLLIWNTWSWDPKKQRQRARLHMNVHEELEYNVIKWRLTCQTQCYAEVWRHPVSSCSISYWCWIFRSASLLDVEFLGRGLHHHTPFRSRSTEGRSTSETDQIIEGYYLLYSFLPCPWLSRIYRNCKEILKVAWLQGWTCLAVSVSGFPNWAWSSIWATLSYCPF